MNVKQLSLWAHRAMDILVGRRYWDKTPGEVVALRRKKRDQDRARRQRRKRWAYINGRYPSTSHRRT